MSRFLFAQDQLLYGIVLCVGSTLNISHLTAKQWPFLIHPTYPYMNLLATISFIHFHHLTRHYHFNINYRLLATHGLCIAWILLNRKWYLKAISSPSIKYIIKTSDIREWLSRMVLFQFTASNKAWVYETMFGKADLVVFFYREKT